MTGRVYLMKPRTCVLVVSLAGLSLVCVGVIAWFLVSFYNQGKEIAAMNRGLAAVELGDSILVVHARLGPPDLIRAGAAGRTIYWNDAPLPQEITTQTVETHVWHPARFWAVFPLSFEVYFDRDGRVIGKHRFD